MVRKDFFTLSDAQCSSQVLCSPLFPEAQGSATWTKGAQSLIGICKTLRGLTDMCHLGLTDLQVLI